MIRVVNEDIYLFIYIVLKIVSRSTLSVSSTVLRKNWNTDFLFIYLFIYLWNRLEELVIDYW